jgi:hypothetical protein
MSDPLNPTPIIEAYTWNYTWCEFMSVANNATCNGDYFAAGSNYFSDPLDCTPFSGSAYANISPSLISTTNVTYTNVAGDVITKFSILEVLLVLRLELQRLLPSKFIATPLWVLMTTHMSQTSQLSAKVLFVIL